MENEQDKVGSLLLDLMGAIVGEHGQTAFVWNTAISELFSGCIPNSCRWIGEATTTEIFKRLFDTGYSTIYFNSESFLDGASVRIQNGNLIQIVEGFSTDFFRTPRSIILHVPEMLFFSPRSNTAWAYFIFRFNDLRETEIGKNSAIRNDFMRLGNIDLANGGVGILFSKSSDYREFLIKQQSKPFISIDLAAQWMKGRYNSLMVDNDGRNLPFGQDLILL